MSTAAGASRDALTMTDTGLWAIRSASETVYLVDLDRWRLLRQPGPHSSTGPYDGEWVPLTRFHDVAVDHRGYYMTDPGGGVKDYRWWRQRRIVSIDPIDEAAVSGIVADARVGKPENELPPAETREELISRRDGLLAHLARRGTSREDLTILAPFDDRAAILDAALTQVEDQLADGGDDAPDR